MDEYLFAGGGGDGSGPGLADEGGAEEARWFAGWEVEEDLRLDLQRRHAMVVSALRVWDSGMGKSLEWEENVLYHFCIVLIRFHVEYSGNSNPCD
jgi:hypothetical protein